MSYSKTVDCVVFGGALIEQVVQVPRLPRQYQDNVAMLQMSTQPGGSGGNVAVYLARLGTPVRLLDRWGDDMEANLLENTLRREGVEVDQCIHDSNYATPFMLILTLPDQDWTGITRIPDAAQLAPNDFLIESVASGKYIHFHGFSLVTKIGQDGVEWAKNIAIREGIQISLDACTPVALEAPETLLRLLPFCRIFFANIIEAQALTDKKDIELAAQDLLSRGPNIVVIKAGKDGCYFIETGQLKLQHCPSVPTKVIDTIGAGDAVVAGVISGLNKNYNISDAVRLGVATASLTCQGMGAQSRIFNLQDIYKIVGHHLGDNL